MALIQFGYNSSGILGDWSDVRNWYDAANAPLNRLPTNSDTVRVDIEVLSNVGTFNTSSNTYILGTFGGAVGGDSASDPNATWTGNTTFFNYNAGTFTGLHQGAGSDTRTSFNYYIVNIHGGNFPNPNTFNWTAGVGQPSWPSGSYLQLKYSTKRYANGNFANVNWPAPTFASNTILTGTLILINTNETYSIGFKCPSPFTKNNGTGYFGIGFPQFQLGFPGVEYGRWNGSYGSPGGFNPTILSDLSTSNTNIGTYGLGGGTFPNAPKFYVGNTSYSGIVYIGTNGANITSDIVFARDINLSVVNAIENSTPFTKTISSANSIFGSSVTMYNTSQRIFNYEPKVTIPIIKNTDGSYTYDMTKAPSDPGFYKALTYNSVTGDYTRKANYNPTIILSNLPIISTNLNADE